MGILGAVLPLELVVFSGGSLQESVKPQAAATPAALLTIHRYCGGEKYMSLETEKEIISTSKIGHNQYLI